MRSDPKTLKLTTNYQGRIAQSAASLLFGIDRFGRFPDAWIQTGRFAGLDQRKILDSSEIRSPVPSAAEAVLSFLRKHSSREAVIGGVKRTDRWTLPPIALREAIINAIVHADYAQRGAPIRVALFDDPLEFENPGLLPFGLTIEDIQQGISKLHNRVIGRVFQELGLIEQWGSGIQRMTAACRESALGSPKFKEIGTHFRLTMSTVRMHPSQHNARDEAAVTPLLGGSGRVLHDVAFLAWFQKLQFLADFHLLLIRVVLQPVNASPLGGDFLLQLLVLFFERADLLALFHQRGHAIWAAELHVTVGQTAQQHCRIADFDERDFHSRWTLS
jgi:ATP-dependent DNA helicase RecG